MRPLAVQIRDRLGGWLHDEDFAAAFGTRGRPGWFPSRLALVTVLQRAENLTGPPAAEAVRTRIGWQYLPGLPLDDPGFDHNRITAAPPRGANALMRARRPPRRTKPGITVPLRNVRGRRDR